MNAVHFHLLVNHLPIIGFLIGAVLFFLSFWKRLGECGRILALAVLVIAALGSTMALVSGEGAEDLIEDVQGISSADIHEHEEMAETANILAIITGLAALGMIILILRKSKVTVWMLILIGSLALATSILMVLTGSSGGQIRHPEISQNWEDPTSVPVMPDVGETEEED